MFIQVLAVLGSLTGFITITLSVAAGLYYFSEIIEENLQLTKRFLSRSILVVSAILILLYLFDGFPFKLTLFTLFSNYVYNLNLRKFPNIQLTNPVFVVSCLLAFVNHYLWFNYFNNPYIPSIDERLSAGFVPPYYPSFTEIASFFGICIWMFPFALFISISSNENGLPLSNSDLATDSSSLENNKNVQKSVNLVRSLIKKSLAFLSNLFNALGINLKFAKSDSSNPNELYI
ncbi:hypothetical protein PICMEDRAFT_70308 [Pichia membranifaciens NRRL Y-2026]|uniref:Protein SVP26 n=1 Tax=Pichia membranifaciens NRRL Y-2026 TaxID=763406 RepID=A0A1E3NRJ1_9ASCO|nr:hypothetical protein PICMEDRAFT_70308 [Pichia membranifaciens NRRL Y-2026]ODQ48691.1 hypothetical protein PICMEDRAFT_70308 [Pichia membranifaciens NRRL Y-2026]